MSRIKVINMASKIYKGFSPYTLAVIKGLELETTNNHSGVWVNFGKSPIQEENFWIDINVFLTALKEKDEKAYHDFNATIPLEIEKITFEKENCKIISD